MDMGQSREITPRERQLVANVASGMNQTQAAIAAGYPPASARGEASRALGRPDIRAHLRALMEEAGIGDKALVARMRAGMEALQRGLTKDGEVVEMGEDWHARAKFMDMALKVYDAYPNPRLDVDMNVNGAIVVLRPDDAVASADPFAGTVIDVTPNE